jgi:hypothetical protein
MCIGVGQGIAVALEAARILCRLKPALRGLTFRQPSAPKVSRFLVHAILGVRPPAPPE